MPEWTAWQKVTGTKPSSLYNLSTLGIPLAGVYGLMTVNCQPGTGQPFTTMPYHTAHDILDHWSQRHQIPGNMICSIDWEAYEEASKQLGLNHQLWIPKWLAGFLSVGKVLQHYKFQVHAECCPWCTEFEDTACIPWGAHITKSYYTMGIINLQTQSLAT